MSTLEQMAEEQTFQDVQGLIRNIAGKHAIRYGQDFDETVGNAFLIYYQECCEDFSEELGQLDKRIAYIVPRRLLEMIRIKARRGIKVGMEPAQNFDADRFAKKESTFNLHDFKDGLSHDAVTMIDVALNTPSYVFRCGVDVRPLGDRLLLYWYFRELGWDHVRFNEAFDEIADSLEFWECR